MSQYNQNQTQVPYSYPAAVEQGPYVAPPPPAGYPTREGELGNHAQNCSSPGKTQSRGDGFLKGCAAALCCCCALDACF